jgi:hypothetical protein
MKTENLSLADLKRTMEQAMAEKGFAGFRPSLEDQILNDYAPFLHFRLDVSDGCGQAFLAAHIKIVPQEIT